MQQSHIVYIVPGSHSFFDSGCYLVDLVRLRSAGILLRDVHIEIFLYPEGTGEDGIVHGIPVLFIGKEIKLVSLPGRIQDMEVCSFKIDFGNLMFLACFLGFRGGFGLDCTGIGSVFFCCVCISAGSHRQQHGGEQQNGGDFTHVVPPDRDILGVLSVVYHTDVNIHGITVEQKMNEKTISVQGQAYPAGGRCLCPGSAVRRQSFPAGWYSSLRDMPESGC